MLTDSMRYNAERCLCVCMCLVRSTSVPSSPARIVSSLSVDAANSTARKSVTLQGRTINVDSI